MSLELYGIPTCGTVKKARAWLEARQVEHTFVDLRKSPPSNEQVHAWIEALTAKKLRNTSGKSYRSLGEEKKTWSDMQWQEAFVADPMLIKRPVIIKDGVPVQVGFRGSDEQLEAALLS